MKPLFKVELCYFGELHEFYSYATSPHAALNNSLTRLAELLGKSRRTISLHIKSGQQRYDIKEIKQDEKDNS